MDSTILQLIAGPYGALILACVFCYLIFKHYQQLINQSLEEHRADRAMYQKTMQELSSEIKAMGKDLFEMKQKL